MRTSEAINDLAAALAAAQGEMGNAPYNRANPHFRSRYADLASVRDATVPALSKHGLAIAQCTIFDGDGFLLVTRLLHASGQWMESVYPLPLMPDKPQAMGSAQSYARRYSWASMCGIASEEDDDGNATAQDGVKDRVPKADFAPNARERAAATEAIPTVAQVGTYQERVKWLKGAKTPDELKERAKTPEHATEVARLTDAQVADLRAYYADRFNELQGSLLSAG